MLQQVSLRVPAGQKVGIIGRTGSGKSSLLLTLLRQTTIEAGRITIDGIDLSHIPETVVCGALVSIPQELCLLPGTVRSNLDPLEMVPDHFITAALRKVGLAEIVETSGGSSADIEAMNMSRGQQQLFGVARALCRKEGLGGRNQGLLLLDEVTSNMDDETEQTILKMLADEFRGWTVLSVAHRLEALTGYDRVVVLEKGRIVEDRRLL